MLSSKNETSKHVRYPASAKHNWTSMLFNKNKTHLSMFVTLQEQNTTEQINHVVAGVLSCKSKTHLSKYVKNPDLVLEIN